MCLHYQVFTLHGNTWYSALSIKIYKFFYSHQILKIQRHPTTWLRGTLINRILLSLKGGCTIFDVEHMSCSFEFWTRESRKNISKLIFYKLMYIFGLRISIATLKTCSQTGWADWAEIFRNVKGTDCWVVYKILSQYDSYGLFYRLMAIKIRIAGYLCS